MRVAPHPDLTGVKPRVPTRPPDPWVEGTWHTTPSKVLKRCGISPSPRKPSRLPALHLISRPRDEALRDQPAQQRPERTGDPPGEHIGRIMDAEIDAAEADDDGEEDARRAGKPARLRLGLFLRRPAPPLQRRLADGLRDVRTTARQHLEIHGVERQQRYLGCCADRR